jgi:broad specificity phosphatase PhoE
MPDLAKLLDKGKSKHVFGTKMRSVIQRANPAAIKTVVQQQFRDGCPDGESPQEVAARADRFIARVLDLGGNVLAFSSGHIIRMIAARWLGLPPAAGRCFFCQPGSVGVLGFEHDSRDQPIVRLWDYPIQGLGEEVAR